MQQFVSDYMEGAHPKILEKLLETNMEKTDGYGLDPYSESAREKIRKAVGAPEAEIYFLAGGTQTNETVISSVLRPYEGVIAADTGHVNTHEAGAIEHGGHKVLTIAGEEGRLSAEKIRLWAEKFLSDANHEHEVAPGMVYISHPTEYGTLYTKEELTKIRDNWGDLAAKIRAQLMPFAEVKENLRKVGAPAEPEEIGVTRARFRETYAGVPYMRARYFSLDLVDRLGLTGQLLDTDDLYEKIGAHAVRLARRIREALLKKGYELYIDSPTNQIFPIVTKEKAKALEEQVQYSFMEELDDGRLVIRFCTSWATRPEDVEELVRLL